MPLTKFSQIFGLGARILGVVLERPYDKIYARGSRWLITVTKKNKMCKMWCRWFWKGQQAKYKLLFHIFPFTLLEKFSSCIASICSMTCTYFEAVFIEMSSKMTVATKLWTLWSQVQYRFKRSTLALIVRHISRDAENQRYWSDLRFIERFLTKIVWRWGCRHCKALAGNALRDIWLFNQIWIMMNKDTMKKLIWFLPVVTRNFELSTRSQNSSPSDCSE